MLSGIGAEPCAPSLRPGDAAPASPPQEGWQDLDPLVLDALFRYDLTSGADEDSLLSVCGTAARLMAERGLGADDAVYDALSRHGLLTRGNPPLATAKGEVGGTARHPSDDADDAKCLWRDRRPDDRSWPAR